MTSRGSFRGPSKFSYKHIVLYLGVIQSSGNLKVVRKSARFGRGEAKPMSEVVTMWSGELSPSPQVSSRGFFSFPFGPNKCFNLVIGFDLGDELKSNSLFRILDIGSCASDESL